MTVLDDEIVSHQSLLRNLPHRLDIAVKEKHRLLVTHLSGYPEQRLPARVSCWSTPLNISAVTA